MQFIYIEDFETLEQYCQSARQQKLVAVDTEFVRTRTLYPNLGLLQAYDGKQLALIDPVAIDDLTPFWQLLMDENCQKIIHSCSEDLEVFLHSGNCKPANMIDSQILLSFLGHGLSMGYAAMVKHFLDIDIDKSESRTDWMKRPLTERQLDYAALDVWYLHQIAPKIIEHASDAGFLTAATEETQAQIDKKFTPIDATKLYLDNKQAWKLKPQQLNLLKALLTWRYEQAVKRNLPFSFVAKDHTLMIVAQRNPQNVGAMASYDGIEILDVRHKGKAMLNVLRAANKIPAEQYPQVLTRLDSYPGYKQIFKQVKLKLTSLAQQHNLDVQVVAGKRQINQFLCWFWKLNEQHNHPEKVELINGWRKEMFKDELVAFAESGF
ncbi:ribonuclease D [Thalassotalea crassostreae]|uniref:ribonuclease D n=1 Tax=Thalassotalea crassostreae TaxID=1763536 RepID=UPI000838FAB7|nr:ribonuclease D [Thalassotalea crassostreae]